MCSGILVKKDDNFFRSALVSVGRMGFVYSLVLKTVPAFMLKEVRSDKEWESFSDQNLTAANFLPNFAQNDANMHFLQVIIVPFPNAV